MTTEGVFESTVEEAKRHPYWIVGGVLGLVALFWLLSSSSSSAKSGTGQNFTFSYGPSDAQVLAGTQLAIAQAGDQTAVTLQGMQTGQATAVAQDYYGYLTNNSANALAATVNTNSTASQIAGINGSTALAEAISGNTTQAQIVGLQTGAATQIAGLQAASADAIASTASATQIAQAGYASQTSIGLANIADNAQWNHDVLAYDTATAITGSAERLAAGGIQNISTPYETIGVQ